MHSRSSIVALAGALLESDRQEDTAIASDARIAIQAVEGRSDIVAANDWVVTRRNRADGKHITVKRRVPIFAIPPGDQPKFLNLIDSEPEAAANQITSISYH